MSKTDDAEHEDVLSAIEARKAALQNERYKLQATQIHKNRNMRQDSRFELFYENIKNAIETLPLPEFRAVDCTRNSEKEYVCAVSDIHYGATFEAQNNTYSRDICKSRFGVLLQELRWLVDEEGISKLKIVNIADTIQGILRVSDLQMNDIPVVDCVVEISRIIAQFLNQLSADCYIEYYHVSAANHSQTRNLGTKANELATEDMERIIANYIEDLLADNDRVTVIHDLSKEYLTFNIFGFKAIAIHGHQIKSIPNAIKDLTNLHREFYDYAFLGHRHSGNETIVGEGCNHNIEVLNCPSFIGSCPYADRLMVGSKAAAKIYVFDDTYGHVESRNIILN